MVHSERLHVDVGFLFYLQPFFPILSSLTPPKKLKMQNKKKYRSISIISLCE